MTQEEILAREGLDVDPAASSGQKPDVDHAILRRLRETIRRETERDVKEAEAYGRGAAAFIEAQAKEKGYL